MNKIKFEFVNILSEIELSKLKHYKSNKEE